MICDVVVTCSGQYFGVDVFKFAENIPALIQQMAEVHITDKIPVCIRPLVSKVATGGITAINKVEVTTRNPLEQTLTQLAQFFTALVELALYVRIYNYSQSQKNGIYYNNNKVPLDIWVVNSTAVKKSSHSTTELQLLNDILDPSVICYMMDSSSAISFPDTKRTRSSSFDAEIARLHI
jgi:hypothetical protein